MKNPLPKVLTLGAVIDIIALTKVPEGEVSADDTIIARIEAYLGIGYVLTPEAEREIAKHRDNIAEESLLDAAE